MDRAHWVQTADRLLRRDWWVSVADAGIDEDQLTRAWREGEDSAAFVAWFAEKYDLIPVRASAGQKWAFQASASSLTDASSGGGNTNRPGAAERSWRR